MSTFARIVDERVLDVINFDPVGRFTDEIAALYFPVPDYVLPNAQRVDGVWVNPPQPLPPTPEQLEEERKAQQEALLRERTTQERQHRNKLLSDCDWTQLPDTPLTLEKQQEWGQYRQALRDVPSQPGFPTDIVWPTPPT